MRIITAIFVGAFLFSTYIFGQVAPDKLVFKKDTTMIDSLKRSEYPYVFPIWGEKVQKLGIALPLSAGLSVNYLWQESDLLIDNLMVGFNNGPMTDLEEVIRLSSSVSNASGVNIRPDLWVLPFLNVYGIIAVAKTSTAIEAGLWLPDSSNNWQEVTAFSSEANFDAQTLGFGLTPTFGVGGGWMALDMNFAWSDVSALDKPAFSFVFGPRLGKTFKFKNPDRTIALWVGGFRLSIASATSGSLNLSEVIPVDELQGGVSQGLQRVEDAQMQVDAWWNGLSPLEQQNPANKARYETANRAIDRASAFLTNLDGALSNAGSATVQYSLEKSQLNEWNFIVGSQFQLNRSLMFRGEFGFLGARKQFIGGIQYRFGL
ncbi:MAG: hypothetical protein HUU32_19720 [Calditrichaceae bacterium]|nr:hypothetical protein [Calditrichia bacterium]NUQ43626.1 hypothetical protein [Calditrichaceae bacterium]